MLIKPALSAALLLGAAVLYTSGPVTAQTGAAPTAPQAEEANSLEVKIFTVSLNAATAAQWGLDGSLADDPSKTPLGKDIPVMLNKEELRTLLIAMRKEADGKITASGSMTAIRGNTTLLRMTKKLTAAENYSEREVPELAEALELGTSIELSPMIKGNIIELELKAQWSRFNAWTEYGKLKMPEFRALSCEQRLILTNGATAILNCSRVPRQSASSCGIEAEQLQNDSNRVVITFATVSTIGK